MTTTTRLGLPLPTTSDSMALGDNNLSDAYDNIDLNCSCRLVSSLSDITVPFNGQHARSALDGNNYIRKNGSWIRSSSPSINGSTLKGSTNITSSVSFTTTETLITSVTFAASDGRRYLIHAFVDIASSDTAYNEVIYRIRGASGGTVANSDTLYHQKTFSFDEANGPRGFGISTGFSADFASFTFGIFAVRNTGAGTFNASLDTTHSNMWVYDWGST